MNTINVICIILCLFIAVGVFGLYAMMQAENEKKWSELSDR